PDEPRAAAVVAGVADEVEKFPERFDAVVGERGLTLSGGQRQRVTLARALAGKAPVLVLDDAFASVDAAKEEEILVNLRQAGAGRTVLLMTHPLRAACAAGRILLLHARRLIEDGRHDEPLAPARVYARLWRIQQLEEEIARARLGLRSRGRGAARPRVRPSPGRSPHGGRATAPRAARGIAPSLPAGRGGRARPALAPEGRDRRAHPE